MPAGDDFFVSAGEIDGETLWGNLAEGVISTGLESLLLRHKILKGSRSGSPCFFFSSCFLKPLSDKSHYPADLKFLPAQSENFLFQDPL